nr:MAG TPA: hypothetical protein [Bacteriophage sp.]
MMNFQEIQNLIIPIFYPLNNPTKLLHSKHV